MYSPFCLYTLFIFLFFFLPPLFQYYNTSLLVVIVSATFVVIIIIKIVFLVAICLKKSWISKRTVPPDTQVITPSIDKFLNDIEMEKPIRFTSQQLRIATDNFTSLLGSGGYGVVYKGNFSKETTVAVKVLYGNSDRGVERQFMAEVGAMVGVHHFNLVRLYGFCFERNLRALVYEYMVNGSLDNYLFHKKTILDFEKLHMIAVGTAKGIAYLHEECKQRIVHYDIKPENILLDENFFPKVADFGLAKLCNRENTHITMTGRRGTPGYAAPELWMPYHVTQKCDVYSFGMLLFEIVGRRRNLERDFSESSQWFPGWVWKKFEKGELEEMMIAIGIEEDDREKADRMIKVAIWCVQERPEMRPVMSAVVKMLEGGVEILTPLCPFKHILNESSGTFDVQAFREIWDGNTFDSSTSMFPDPSVTCATPIMRKHEIEIVSRQM